MTLSAGIRWEALDDLKAATSPFLPKDSQKCAFYPCSNWYPYPSSLPAIRR